jgi:hypothetical protein
VTITDRVVVLLCAAHLAVGCTPEAPPAPTDPERIPERSVSASDIAETWTRSGDYLVSPALEAPDGATRVGALVTLARGARAPVLEARGETGAWHPLEVTWSETPLFVARAELEVVAHRTELRLPVGALLSIAAITWDAVVPERPVAAPPPVEGDIGATQNALDSVFVTAGVVSRADWGARATTCTTTDPNKWRMAIHHTATPSDGDPAVRVRGIQAYHMDTNGWCDIGYHFLVSIDGRVWEGRTIDLLGAHVLGSNDGNIGISFIGCFQDTGCMTWTPFTPPDVMLNAGIGMVRLLSDIYSIPVSATTVMGHRDYPNQTTDCPGDNLHALLDSIRASANLPSYGAELVDDSFLAVTLPPGGELAGYIEVRNIGYETWQPGETMLGTSQPHDSTSVFAGSEWISNDRPATIDQPVATGATGRFNFTVHAPTTPGEYTEYFDLVEGRVVWFSDIDQGGPADDVIAVHVTVSESPADGGADAGVDGGREHLSAGCSCRAAPSRSDGLALAFVALLFTVRRGARRGSRTTRRREHALRR